MAAVAALPPTVRPCFSFWHAHACRDGEECGQCGFVFVFLHLCQVGTGFGKRAGRQMAAVAALPPTVWPCFSFWHAHACRDGEECGRCGFVFVFLHLCQVGTGFGKRAGREMAAVAALPPTVRPCFSFWHAHACRDGEECGRCGFVFVFLHLCQVGTGFGKRAGREMAAMVALPPTVWPCFSFWLAHACRDGEECGRCGFVFVFLHLCQVGTGFGKRVGWEMA
jgi:hypothetical protein